MPCRNGAVVMQLQVQNQISQDQIRDNRQAADDAEIHEAIDEIEARGLGRSTRFDLDGGATAVVA